MLDTSGHLLGDDSAPISPSGGNNHTIHHDDRDPHLLIWSSWVRISYYYLVLRYLNQGRYLLLDRINKLAGGPSAGRLGSKVTAHHSAAHAHHSTPQHKHRHPKSKPRRHKTEIMEEQKQNG